MHHSATAPREIWAKRHAVPSIFSSYYIFVFFLFCSIFLPSPLLLFSSCCSCSFSPFPIARRRFFTVRPNWIGGFAVRMRNLTDRAEEENRFLRLYRHRIYLRLIPMTVYRLCRWRDILTWSTNQIQYQRAQLYKWHKFVKRRSHIDPSHFKAWSFYFDSRECFSFFQDDFTVCSVW